MYWDEELERLALHKAALQRRIARHRVQCSAAAGRIARPFDRLDRIIAIWRGIPSAVKLGAVPLGLFATRLALPRRGFLRKLARWGPLVFTVVRAFSSPTNRVAHRRPLAR